MKFKIGDLETGDVVLVQGKAVNRVCERQVTDPDNSYILFLAMRNNQNKVVLMNPDYGSFPVECISLSELGSVKRDGELLYPKAFLTAEEKAFILNLKSILQPSTRLIKYQSLGGVTENIALLDVKTVLKRQETVNFPSFRANSLYKGLNANEEYTLESLGIVLEDE